ncbi:ephrin type-A receptor 4-A-like [Clytia hemisphaerica]|uniref:receptor protein-tyrosine kinase n=1 Tax=Clytia hemisphaerica TaxID=252671 RepID=A0A7M5XBK1_9CNID
MLIKILSHIILVSSLFIVVQAKESLLFDSDEVGFRNWTVHLNDVNSPKNFKNIHYPNKTSALTILYSDVPKYLIFVSFMSPSIDVQPAWKVFIQAEILVDSKLSTAPYTFRMGHTSRETPDLDDDPIEDRLNDHNLHFKPSDKVEIDLTSKSRTETFKYLYLDIWFGWGTLFEKHHPGVENVTLSSLKISYLNCPAETRNLAFYPNTPASREKLQPVYDDGLCVTNAVKLEENLPLQRTCDDKANAKFETGECVCDATFEKDSTGENCQLCEEGYYKSIKGHAQCQKCGKNSFNDRSTRYECRCGNVESGPTFRLKEEEEKKNWAADCFSYPTKVRDVKTDASSLTNDTIGLSWSTPSNIGELKPVIYVVECIHPVAVCNLFTEYGGRREMERTQNETVILQNLTSHTNFTVRVCTHNEASLSNLGSDIGGKPACSAEIQDDKMTFTQDGYPTKVLGLIVNPATVTNTISVTWQKPLSTGSNSYEYLVRYAGITEKVPEQNTVNKKHSFTVDDPDPERLLLDVEVLVSAKPNNGPFAGQTITGPSEIRQVTLKAPYVDEWRTLKIALGVVGGIFGFILIIMAIVYFYRWYERKIKLHEEELIRIEYENRIHVNKIELLERKIDLQQEHTNLYVSMETRLGHEDPMKKIYDSEPIYEEIPQVYNFKKFKDIQTLGEGEFGFVIKARASNICGHYGDSWVAVKRLKVKCSAIDKEDFIGELNLLKELGHHQNVVRLLGECNDPSCIILEYLPGGDLLGFLKKSRGYRKGPDGSEESFLTTSDLLNFSLEICEGMKHIASNGIVHRDLAARNVLVGYNKICKISDLGLARKLNDKGYYHRNRQAKLPVRWMPLESIKNNIASEKSDVWSFGITLYEIFTIGGMPYPGLKSKEIPDHLAAGKRMKKPDIKTCTPEIYSLMLDCWEHRDVERPTFTQLVERIQSLQEATNDNYKNLDIVNECDAYLDFVGDEMLGEDTVFIDPRLGSHYDVEKKLQIEISDREYLKAEPQMNAYDKC